MLSENVLKEWYTENASRRMPLATLVAENNVVPSGLDDAGQLLPESLLVGLQLYVPRTMLATREAGSTLPYDQLANEYRIYLSSVVIATSRVEMTFSTVSGADIAQAIWTPTTEMQGIPVHGVQVAPLPTNDENIGSSKVSGFVFFGPDSMWREQVGIYRYTGNNIYSSMISESCINCIGPDIVTGLVVNGTTLHGEIGIVAGDNVDINVQGNNIDLAFAGGLDTGITTRQELVQAVVDTYGNPILTINGVLPDGNGNYTFSSPDGVLSFSNIDHGIAVVNLKGSECCDKSALDNILSNIQADNEKMGRLNNFMQALSANMNDLQNALAYLKMTYD
jgi:hypothetical protein